MEFKQALEIVLERTKHTRFRDLCDPNHPDYKPAYKDVVIKLAEQLTGKITTQNPIPDQYHARMEICRNCVEHFDAVQIKCKLCGCQLEMKTRNSQDACPIGKW